MASTDSMSTEEVPSNIKSITASWGTSSGLGADEILKVTVETEREPTQEEIERIGDLSAELSELSEKVEHDDFQLKPKTTGLGRWFQNIRPMIHGRFMWCLTITNITLFVLLVLLFIYLIIFAILGAFSYQRYHELSAKFDNLDHCSVHWQELSNCSAQCHNSSQHYPYGNLPVRSRHVVDVIGKEDKCLPHSKEEDKEKLNAIIDYIPCNVWSCDDVDSVN